MKAALTRLVRDRVGRRCEYCRLPEGSMDASFEIDHIIARKHKGRTSASNLCLSCWHCNVHKGSNLTGIDPKTKKLTRLFNPRRHKWLYHFCYQSGILIGRTAIGRTTVSVLEMNRPDMVGLREELIKSGAF